MNETIKVLSIYCFKVHEGFTTMRQRKSHIMTNFLQLYIIKLGIKQIIF